MSLKHLYQLLYSLHDPVHVERFQRLFGLQFVVAASDETTGTKNVQMTADGKRYVIRRHFWFWLFSFGARLGYELFYAFSFSYLYWNIDSLICRRLMLVWAVLMYVGQALKEMIRIPRPNGPRILILEPEYSFEYGMPSTHAMLALMAPVTLYYILAERYQISMPIFLVCAICWCSLICCSRLYLGMHSVLDIVVGLLLTGVLLVPVLPALDPVDHFLVRNWLAPLTLIPCLILFALIYPTTNERSPSRGDTTAIISAFAGVYLGSWLNFQLGIISPSGAHHPGLLYPIVWPELEEIPIIVTRTVIGLVSIFVLRSIGKRLAHFMIQTFTGIKDPKSAPHLTVVEIPDKMTQFVLIGLGISFFGPMLGRLLTIHRQSMAFEA